MHLQQTKRGSRATGGPQYYFHDLPDIVKFYLREKGAARVALVTPYGATKSDYFAVSADHKLDSKLQPIAGKVGHDRIQQGRARKGIGESIRHWYKLPAGDFERIDLDIEIKRNSAGFKYQQQKYGKDELSRAIILCAIHSHKHLPKNIDVIELESLCNYSKSF